MSPAWVTVSTIQSGSNFCSANCWGISSSFSLILLHYRLSIAASMDFCLLHFDELFHPQLAEAQLYGVIAACPNCLNQPAANTGWE